MGRESAEGQKNINGVISTVAGQICLCGIQMCVGVTGQIGWVGSLQAYLYEY